jgi:hypothetical protein
VSSDLEGTADLVEGVAVVAHDAAGLVDVAELLRALQQKGFSSVLCDVAAVRFLRVTCVFVDFGLPRGAVWLPLWAHAPKDSHLSHEYGTTSG